MTDVKLYTRRILLRILDRLFLDKSHPSVFQFLSFVENKRDKCANVLSRKSGCRDAALAFMRLALCSMHTTPNKPFNESPRCRGLLVDGRVFHDVRYRNRVEREKSGFPL
jgi:hypothetical protein